MAKKTIKLHTGTVYQKTEKGNYYFRYQINGERKAISRKTKNKKDAINKANELIPIINADSTEIIRNIYSLATSQELADIAFKRWFDMAKASKIPELITMANTIKKHIDGVLAFWSTGGVTSASMEGFNNKIGWLTRLAYGYRDEEYLILKIYDLPNLKVAKEL